MATPIAVAVREALFTSSGRTHLISRGVQPSLLCTASVYVARLGSFLSCSSILDLYRNALAKACPFNLGSLRVGVVLFWPVSPGSWPGGAWVPWRALPWSLLFLVALLRSRIFITSCVSLFHLQKGPRPNS